MALFSQQPPGVQIKRWLFILTFLVIVIDFIAAASLMVVTNLMSSIVTRYEPLVIYSGDIASSVYRVHTGLYQYLAEYRQDTLELQSEIDGLRGTIKEAYQLEAAADLGTNLEEIDLALEKYGKVIKLLPKIGTITDWQELEELKNHAVGLGKQVEELALEMKELSNRQIQERAERSSRVASIAMYVFLGFLVLSIVIVVLLFLWWRDFQEMILRL